MRLLLWYWGRRGAGGQLTLSLAEALARRPDTAVALSLSRRADLLAPIAALGLPTDTVDTYGGAAGFVLGLPRVPFLARRLAAQARAHRADAVVSVMTHLWTPLVAPALRRAGIPFVPLVHDAASHPGDPGLWWDWRLDRELDAARMAIALSSAVEAALRARRPRLPVARLPLGAHLPADILRSAAPNGPAGDFLFFGRFRAYKGLDLLRDAFRLLRQSHPEARLRVVGEGDAEALAPGLSALGGVRVEPRWVAEADIPPLLATAGALVLPYREASQSGVVSLAHALGVPVVATPVGGLAEQVTDGVDGAVATAAEPAALAEAMARLCDPAERDRLAAGARRTGRTLTDWDAQAAALLDAMRGFGIGAGQPGRSEQSGGQVDQGHLGDEQMSDRVLKAATSPDGRERVIVVQRPDGRFSYRRQFREDESRLDSDSVIGDWTADDRAEAGWTPPGPYAGVYDSAETAEREAVGKLCWPPAFSEPR